MRQIQGKRIPDNTSPKNSWEYSKIHARSGFPEHWVVAVENDGKIAFGTLMKHKVVEHEDGTITVSPSILYEKCNHHPGWHGYLEKGMWREC